jgi:hypothetical protein
MKYMVERVRGEYLEMPGLSLTERQAQRLWQLEEEACRRLFEALVESGFLRQTSRGGYVRADLDSPGAPALSTARQERPRAQTPARR